MIDAQHFDWWVRDHQPQRQTYWLQDHFGDFDHHFRNPVLDAIPAGSTVYSEYLFPEQVIAAYPQLIFRFSAALYTMGNSVYTMSTLAGTSANASVDLRHNFLCCFNRSYQAGRNALLAELHIRDWYQPGYCTKHFALNLQDCEHYGVDTHKIDRRFSKHILANDFHAPTDHAHNFRTLQPLINQSFVNLVSETKALGTTVPFPTEKFLYPIASRSLWVALAPPNYHKLINQKFKFELYSCFDYYFDSVWDSTQRLRSLLTMLDQFAQMTPDQWADIYQQQQPVIERNYQRLANFGFFDDLVDLDQCDVLEHLPPTIDCDSAWFLRYVNRRFGIEKQHFVKTG